MSKDVYTSISINLKTSNNVEEFCDVHKKNKAFQVAIEANPNFLTELYYFIYSNDKYHRSIFHVFKRELKIYFLDGFGSFFYRAKDDSANLIPAGPKMKYLEELNKRKTDFIWQDLKEVNDLSSKVYEWQGYFNKEFYIVFKEFGLTQLQSDVYSRSLSYATTNILQCVRNYYKDLTEFQILGFQDNRVNIAKGQVSESFKHFHKLIAYIDIKFTPHKKLKALKFLDYYIKELNDSFFGATFLYEILDNEKNKLYNSEIIEQIKLESKLQEQDLLLSETIPETELTNKKEALFNKQVFRSFEAQEWFSDTLFELSAIDELNKPAWGFQAKCKAVFDNIHCKKHIFKLNLPLASYIVFLKDNYSANIKSEDKMSSGQKHEADIHFFIDTFIKDSKKDLPE